jgi:hypothetical protein
MKTNRILAIIFILVLSLFTQQCQAQTADSYGPLLDAFQQWKLEQITKGSAVSQKDCTIDAVVNSDGNHPGIAIPDEFLISYAKINDDDQMDALVLFNPIQCDGGSALMNAQTRLLILSQGTRYVTDDRHIDEAERSLLSGIDGYFQIERAEDGHFFGTLIQYAALDARCCPSIKRGFRLSYKTGDITFFDE